MAKKKQHKTPGLFDAPKTAEQIKMENAQDLYNFLFEACNILRGPVRLTSKTLCLTEYH